MNTAYIIDAVRTPIGKYGGKLAYMRADDMLAYVINALLQRNDHIDLHAIEQVIAGDANQAGEDCRNVARMAALLTGLPAGIGGTTINSLCASGMEAIMQAARGIICGDGLLYIAGGVESMTRAPFIMPKKEGDWNTPSNGEVYNSTIGWRFTNSKLAAMYPPYPMGETAEHIAQQWNISREAQDAFAQQSHQKYFAALEQGKWDDEIVPVEMNNEDQLISWFTMDEAPRKLSAETLAALKPAFVPNGTVTAGNSSGLNDGAAMLLLASEEAVRMYDLQPMAKIVSMGVAGVDPAIMGMAPVPATFKALHRAKLKMSDMDLIELNESFAAQALACIKELETDEQKVNVNGGSLAIGHPMGCSGARITTTLVHEMLRSNAKYGLATTCAGMGQGAALVLERI
ncbi:thiolase family protein [Ilyomonas limi]|uniref:Thiolase family protein n=1 Tax=Ilyomonas limi TaxID=2575867 RepID=A0A4U3L0T7_9BACT|nr:thiolase family protein [Ilyomonas limi]TKK67774.1 thiolase family protein [Ilyomonas limi]